MKKLTKLTFLTGMVVLAGLSLSACNDKTNKPAAPEANTTSQTAPQQTTPVSPDKSVFVGDFDATQARMKAYLDSKFNFNEALPLRDKFLPLLNGISNAQYQATQQKLTTVDNDLFVLRSLATLNTQFNNIIQEYSKDPAQSEKTLNALGLNLDFKNASFTTLINQLNQGCVKNQNYQIDIQKIKSGLIIKQDGKVIPFPESETQKLNDWNRNMVNVCTLTNEFYQVVNTPKFSYDNLPDMIKAAAEKVNAKK